jgi:hypothetical protein
VNAGTGQSGFGESLDPVEQRNTQEAMDEDARAMETTMGLRELSAELDKSRNMSIGDESYADKSADTTIEAANAATTGGPKPLAGNGPDLSTTDEQQIDSARILGSDAGALPPSPRQAAREAKIDKSEQNQDQSEDAETQRDTPFFGPAVDTQTQSQSQSRGGGETLLKLEPVSQSTSPENGHSDTIPFPSSAASRVNERILNLTDIGDMGSSQVEHSQIEIEATQLEYDVERIPPPASTSASDPSGERVSPPLKNCAHVPDDMDFVTLMTLRSGWKYRSRS